LKLITTDEDEARRWSPAARGRGLKPHLAAPVGDAPASPAARGRGLKLITTDEDEARRWSPAARGRGLKLQRAIERCE